MESENYVYKKEIDWSTLMEGFTLPLDNQVIFLRNMENFLLTKFPKSVISLPTKTTAIIPSKAIPASVNIKPIKACQ